ncbi:PREDICTED: protein VASCULAR ASSOCIATED DEATH 1, chloroplastic-like isoform X2 [Lupinus angustifolius]|uniref:protein VASCULAR ASSOCIATED DEATH 1, chloroplastic-like isoform X2 n=1 Tax=Lupinus angustifolius TaxID=3871 RepID=UPI00092E873F|nr:PREDICTED: protein VASCULAR ASSOCIATED DEATH 1, chloroplastic-like isoform X2 [Lupinus angustifolius]
MASTAVATTTATATATGIIEPPHQQTLDPPSSSRPSSASAEDAVDRYDSCNSSPNLLRESEIQLQSMDVLKSEEYRQLFHLPLEEVLIEDFNCALQENILIQGHMYLFVNFICFYSNIFGFETKRIIPLPEVTGVRRAKTAGLFPNAIEIIAGSRKHFFASFLSRDDAFKIINDGWLRRCNGSTIITEQQESISELSSQENGFIAIENVKSAEILDKESLFSELSKDTSICKDVGLPSHVGDDPELMTAPEKQSSMIQVAKPVLNNDAPSVSWNWKEDDIDAPTIPEGYTCVAESVFPIMVEDFFRFFFSDDGVKFLESFHKRCGDKDFVCSSWHPQEKFGYAREVSFQHPIKLYLGAKFGGCHVVQKYRVYRTSHLVIETVQDVTDVLYSDYFRVEGLWDIERDKDESKECCILRVYVNVAFLKKTIWKGKIVQGTIDECREAYATWMNMAHELLKQKNLEEQESSAIAVVTQNDNINFHREGKTEESSEASIEQINPTTIQTTSNVSDATHNVNSSLQGNFIDTTSIPSLFKEFMTKFRLSLKNQSNLSMLLVTIFTLIFFMQFSILMLLARPQQIHVSTGADYMNKMGSGMTRNPSDIAWMEKRIHHLKDEMYMVETRLERMRYEHALLKNQLKDLDLK